MRNPISPSGVVGATNERLRDRDPAPLIGYMRVSKADGSQALDLQKDALSAAGVSERHL